MPAPLGPRTTRRLPRSTARSTPFSTGRPPYDLARPTAPSGIRPHGSGSGSLILAVFPARRTGSRPASIRPARRAMLLAVVAVADHDTALLADVVNRVFHLDADRAAVDIHNTGWETYLAQRAGEERRRAREDDQDQAALVAPQEAAQPRDGADVEVVGRLVHQQRAVGPAEQDAGQLHPAPLPAGQRAHRTAHDVVGQAEPGRHSGRLRLGGVPARGLEGRLRAGVGAHRAVQRGRPVGPLHGRLGGTQPVQRPVQGTGGQDAVQDGDGGVGGAGVLGEEPDGTGGGDRARGGPGLSGEGGHQGGLARAVAADETDPVAGGDGKGDLGQQKARARAQFDIANGDHEVTLRTG
ncbi:hypothetical protein SUDANB37_05452 [Streptomyces sp. enrichment culture]